MVLSTGKISTVIPNYNHSEYILEAVDSVLSQSLAPARVVIIDDCSTDDSVEIITGRISGNKRVLFLKNEENMGVMRTLIKGLNFVETEFVHLGAADDVIEKDFYLKSVGMLEKYPDAAFSSSDSYWIDTSGNPVSRGRVHFPETSCYISPQEFERMYPIQGNWFPGNTSIFRSHTIKGHIHPELGSYADEFMRTFLALQYGACFIPERLGTWRINEEGYASQQTRDWRSVAARLLEIDRIIAENYQKEIRENIRVFMIRRLLADLLRKGYRDKATVEFAVGELERRKLTPPHLAAADIFFILRVPLYARLVASSVAKGITVLETIGTVFKRGNPFKSFSAPSRY